MNPFRLLSTKKLNADSKSRLQESGVVLIQHDWLSIEFLDFNWEGGYDYLFFTSQNAVRSVLQHSAVRDISQIPVYCVGEKTRDLLMQNGFYVIGFSHYAEDLVQRLKVVGLKGKVAFFCGNLRREVLPNYFNSLSITWKEIPVYNNTIQDMAISEQFEGVVFQSPSAVQGFLKSNSVAGRVCFCIGTTTAQALEGTTAQIVLSEKPTQESLVMAVVNYLKNKPA